VELAFVAGAERRDLFDVHKVSLHEPGAVCVTGGHRYPGDARRKGDSRTAVIRSEVREPAARCLARDERLHNIFRIHLPAITRCRYNSGAVRCLLTRAPPINTSHREAVRYPVTSVYEAAMLGP